MLMHYLPSIERQTQSSNVVVFSHCTTDHRVNLSTEKPLHLYIKTLNKSILNWSGRNYFVIVSERCWFSSVSEVKGWCKDCTDKCVSAEIFSFGNGNIFKSHSVVAPPSTQQLRLCSTACVHILFHTLYLLPRSKHCFLYCRICEFCIWELLLHNIAVLTAPLKRHV